ncbi:MAG: hypothetical protein PHT07_24670, partial [Paludibacter sp.]|nr:hypothetical protein [Paludibacter sp.]
MKKTHLTILLCLLCVLCVQAQQIFKSEKGLRFEMQDEIKSELYEWPQTLLTYPVKFEETVDANQLLLTDEIH